MPTPATCPFCGGSQLVDGNVIGSEGFGFKPNDLITGFVATLRSPWAFHFGPAACFCPECCMVWSQADAEDAAEFIAKFANEELKARLAIVPIGAGTPPPPG